MVDTDPDVASTPKFNLLQRIPLPVIACYQRSPGLTQPGASVITRSSSLSLTNRLGASAAKVN